jgi:hypothetical protein
MAAGAEADELGGHAGVGLESVVIQFEAMGIDEEIGWSGFSGEGRKFGHGIYLRVKHDTKGFFGSWTSWACTEMRWGGSRTRRGTGEGV